MSFLSNLPTSPRPSTPSSTLQMLKHSGPRKYVATENTDPPPDQVVIPDKTHPFVRMLYTQPENQPDLLTQPYKRVQDSMQQLGKDWASEDGEGERLKKKVKR
ncbi:uncharacterized protein SPPG_09259 [Spizellomyces punctatus DAOM BR117]|uniref:DET1- and DDB1-associated protein 1 domain-containing protein n=1 Tax=Spizellomyces punctatus (strain DAOM BR117) TaxID=645134 RepID=A0A0L0HFH0_SPIPD|nr:uncharacterized protein SPPG_09259 [Spizellomyces punctatus DAOM BR117]KNC99766.1 hypothetical protein SPPG_09259 [Spizellomyces punctatus DAOM BR117]|eukprot:XP_016607806.1 hypothetical protein SPPG_09259 [Spizellomyces punctatus DAOM BR117]